MNTPELSGREISLIYFQRFQDAILQRLQITQDPATLTDDDRVGLVWAFLDIISG
jgi:hypothetical protein